MKKWTKTFLLVIAVVSAISMMSMTAFAAEGDVIDESFSGVEIPAEELIEGGETVTTPVETTDPTETEDVPIVDDVVSDDGISDETVGTEDETDESNSTDKADDAFSVDGNGEVLDNVMDEKSGKEFYTITTANNNTYYLIIDHSSSTKNVYMLSMIDENDLKEFLSEEEPEVPEDTGTPPAVDFGDEPSGDDTPDDSEPEEPKKDNNILSTVLIILVLGAIAGGGYFYFKIYKPKKEAQISDEDMEYVDEGVTINEDEESEVGEVNATTPIDELAFDDEEPDTYDEE